MAIWCVPGAPLADGGGWRICYSRPGPSDFTPQQVKVRWGFYNVEVEQQTQLLSRQETPSGLGRRIAMADVKLKQPIPGVSFRVTIPELRRSFWWSTRPNKIDADSMSLILSSCFWQNDDGGYFRSAVQSVLKYEKPRPAFKLLVGDQVYLDYPVSFNPFAGAKSITANRYEQYWGDGDYRDALLATPNFTCDDHEYWNDYPEKQIHLDRSRGSDRNEYASLADDYYRTFQLALNNVTRRWFSFDIEPASFFVTDTRSRREFYEDDGSAHFMPEKQWEDLERWQRGLKGPGFLVLGQPLFQEDGNWKVHSLSNFRKDYARLLRIIEQSLKGDNDEQRRHDIVILSGDIHTGRYSWASIAGQQEMKVHELIASPASRVGPFLSEPDPQRPPSRIPPSPTPGRVPWQVGRRSRTDFETVENNVGVLRLRPAAKRPYKLNVEFVTYLVPPAP